MQLRRIELRNFRCFETFTLDLAGESLLVIGPNAGGKTSLLAGVRRALHGGAVARHEFRDLATTLELIVTVSGIPPAAHGAFAEAMDFSTTPPTMRIGTRATWDPAELEVDSVYGFPDNGWHRAGREARQNLPLLSLPAWRDPSQLVPVVGRRSLFDELISGLALDQALDQAVSAMTTASQQLAGAAPLRQLLTELRMELASLLPRVDTDAFSLGLDVARPEDVLRQFELLLAHRGPETRVSGHSDGLKQASIFVLALRLLAVNPGALLLVDEPEVALHPQAHRALVAALRDRAEQSIIATHSAAVLDRVDPREITRLRRASGGDTETVRVTHMDPDDARRLSRYATSHTAEAYFAETVILVEGFSDLLAVRGVASRLGVNLDAAGVSVLSLEGSDLFKHYAALLGPHGLDLGLRGLCDLDAEADWMAKLNAVGINVVDRATLNAAGVQVCDPDLEAELLGPVSEPQVEQVFAGDGALNDFRVFSGQPSNAGLSGAELQLRYVKKDKIRWAPLIAEAIAPPDVPSPIAALLANL